MTYALTVGPFQPALEDAFCRAVATLRASSPLAPMYVLVPTHVLGRHLLRTVARRHGVCANVRFHTFPDLAETIGIEAFLATQRIPLPPLADYLITRQAVNAAVQPSGYFAPICQCPGTARSIQTTLEDLKKAGVGPEELRAFGAASGSSKLSELAAIYEAAERLRRDAGYLDLTERLRLAAEQARLSRLLAGSLGLCLYGFSDLNRVEAEFVDACLERRPGDAFVPDDVGGQTDTLIEWLRARGFVTRRDGPGSAGAAAGPRALAPRVFSGNPPDRPTDCAVTIVSAPGVAQEVQELARHVLRFVEHPGASFSDVAVLLRHPPAYERTIRDVFAAAAIPHVFLEGVPLSETLAGRLLRLLVRIRRGGYRRAEIMEFLGLAPLRASLLAKYPDASPVDWDRYSREAGIVAGREHWRRLGRMRGRLDWRLRRLRRGAPEEQDAAAIAVLEQDLRSLDVFHYVVNVLLKRLDAIAEEATVGTLMAGFLRSLQSMAAFEEEDRRVLQTLADAARDKVADEAVTLDAFATLIEDLVAERLPATEVYRAGKVAVSSLTAAAGLPFRLVLMPGLVERSFPQPVRQDPVLLDQEREALAARCGRPLAPRSRRLVEERFLFRHALGAAEESLVLSYPRLDAATGQVRVASHYLLRVAEALTGTSTDYKTLDALSTRIPVSRLAADDPACSPAEWDLAAVARAVQRRDLRALPGLPGFRAMANGTRAETARWGHTALSEYDGLLGTGTTLPPTMAATHLETYGTCPFRYFGERVLRIRELDEPEAVETITPLDRGALLHDILEAFFAGLVRDGLVPLRDVHLNEYRERLRSVAEQAFTRFEASGAVGYPFMWQVERERILTDLEGVLAAELAGEGGYVPQYFEARFGPAPSWATVSVGSMPEPLELTVRGRVFRFTGYIDRIDVGNGVARVLDYKTGGVYGERDNAFRGGESLQLPLYILAADAMLAHHEVPAHTAEAFYYYATGRAKYKRVVFTRDALDARRQEFFTILDTIADGIERGVFPQHPGNGGENCRWCPFKPACGQSRMALAERKAGDPRLAPLNGMWNLA